MEFLNNDCEVQGLIRAAFITLSSFEPYHGTFIVHSCTHQKYYWVDSIGIFFVSCCHKTNTSLNVKNRLIGAYENVWTRRNKPSKALPSRLICFWIEIVNLLRAQLTIVSLYHILYSNLFAMLCKIKVCDRTLKTMLILH